MSWLVRRLASWGGPRSIVIGLGIVGLAFLLRAWRIGELPPGLLSDEGYNLIDILDMRDTGTYPLFFERNLGREPLFIYLQALSVAMFGPTPFAARIVSVFLGTLTVALLHRFARNVFGADSWIPAASSLVLAATLYHTILSRVGLRSISLPPLTIAALLALWAAYQAGKPRFFLAAGAGFALTFYSYIAARSLPLIPVGLLALSGLRGWPQPERLPLKVSLASVTFLVLLVPLGFVAWRSPNIFWERSGT